MASTPTALAFMLGGAEGGGCGGDPAGGAVPLEVVSPEPSWAGGSGGAEAAPVALLMRCANGDSDALEAVDIGDIARAGGWDDGGSAGTSFLGITGVSGSASPSSGGAFCSSTWEGGGRRRLAATRACSASL